MKNFSVLNTFSATKQCFIINFLEENFVFQVQKKVNYLLGHRFLGEWIFALMLSTTLIHQNTPELYTRDCYTVKYGNGFVLLGK